MAISTKQLDKLEIKLHNQIKGDIGVHPKLERIQVDSSKVQ